ncbi:SRPBCC family protein [Yinghuangia aomiensis]
MSNRAILAAAVAGGYVLGRTKKGRMAIGVGSYLLTRHYHVNPRELVAAGAERLGAAPELQHVTDRVRKDVTAAGKSALTAQVERRVGALADRLEDRADELDKSPYQGRAKDDGEPEPSGPSRSAKSGGAAKSGSSAKSGGASKSGSASKSGGSSKSAKSAKSAKSSGSSGSAKGPSRSTKSSGTSKTAKSSSSSSSRKSPSGGSSRRGTSSRTALAEPHPEHGDPVAQHQEGGLSHGHPQRNRQRHPQRLGQRQRGRAHGPVDGSRRALSGRTYLALGRERRTARRERRRQDGGGQRFRAALRPGSPRAASRLDGRARGVRRVQRAEVEDPVRHRRHIRSGGPGRGDGRQGRRRGKSQRSAKKFTHITEVIDVGVPVDVAYDHWTRYDEFSEWSKGVRSVDEKDDDESNWKVKIGPSSRTWQAKVQEETEDERIVWTSDGAKGSTRGVVTFHEIGDRLTRIVVDVEYHPSGPVERVGNMWRVAGRRLRLDLKRFRHHVMFAEDHEGDREDEDEESAEEEPDEDEGEDEAEDEGEDEAEDEAQDEDEDEAYDDEEDEEDEEDEDGAEDDEDEAYDEDDEYDDEAEDEDEEEDEEEEEEPEDEEDDEEDEYDDEDEDEEEEEAEDEEDDEEDEYDDEDEDEEEEEAEEDGDRGSRRSRTTKRR